MLRAAFVGPVSLLARDIATDRSMAEKDWRKELLDTVVANGPKCRFVRTLLVCLAPPYFGREPIRVPSQPHKRQKYEEKTKN